MLRLLLLLTFSALLVGCAATPGSLGISQKQWSSYSPEKRQQIMAGHQKIKKTKVSQKEQKVYNGPNLSVYLAEGVARMAPADKPESFQTMNFQIKAGECKSITLNSIDSHDDVAMNVCYNGMTLSMDPSRYVFKGRNGTAHFDYNPIWKTGFTYGDVVTTGYARLSHAHVTIKALPRVAPIEDDSFYNS
jgi:hypothetical protein